MDRPSRIFLLSPAHCGGKRASYARNPAAEFAIARQLRSAQGAPLGEVFAFLSGLYFRRKLAYARHFTLSAAPVYVITTNRGLLPHDTLITAAELGAFGAVDIASNDSRYRGPLESDSLKVLGNLLPDAEVVLLGSIATGKYTEVLLSAFGSRLVFPREFVGRGDMSRGALLLRAVEANAELEYACVEGARLTGRRASRVSQTS